MHDLAGMAASPVKLAIEAVNRIRNAVEGFGQGDGRDKFSKFLDELKNDLKKLQNATIIGCWGAPEAMKNLKKALLETANKANNEEECKSITDILKAFEDRGITTKLDKLRKVIAEGMLSEQLGSIMGTGSQGMMKTALDSITGTKETMSRNIAAVYALHGPLREVVLPLLAHQ
jgi:hypothetical protein